MKKIYYYVVMLVGFCLSLTSFMETSEADIVEPKGAVQFSQPSGEIFKATFEGDEWLHYAVVESTEEVLLRDAEGTWFYALIDEQTKQLVASQSKYLIDEKPQQAVSKKELETVAVSNPTNEAIADTMRTYPKTTAVNGANRTLIVMIEYNDFALKNSKQDWYNRVFQRGSLSVNDYYEEATKGTIQFSPLENTQEENVPGVIKIKLDKDHPNSGFDSNIAEKTREDINLALEQVKEYIDLEQVDSNHNQYITPDELHMLFVFSGYSASAAYDPMLAPTVWPHKSYTKVEFGTKTITDYTVVTDLRKTRVEAADHMMSIGTIVHELGHDLGLPDLYNPSGTKGAGLGSYSVMANSHTTMNGQISGTYPVHFDAYSKVKLGIVTPTVIEHNQTVNINDIFSQDTNIIRINTKDDYRYYLLENRQFKGFDTALKTYIKNPGIGIYYVDESIGRNQGAGKQIVTLKEADEGVIGYSRLNANAYGGYDGFYYNLTNHPTLLDGDTTPSTRLPDQTYLDYAINVLDAPQASMAVTFSTPTIPVDSVQLSQTELRLEVGQEEQVTATIMPENASNQTLEWRSSDSAIASVDEKGNITAKKVGATTITAQAAGKSTSVTVTVLPKKGNLGSVSWEWEEATQTVTFVNEGEFPTSKVQLSEKIEKDPRLDGKKIKKIVFKQPVKLNKNASYLFANLSALESIEGLDKLDTSNVTDMSYLFANTTSLSQLDVSTWDTSKVTTMYNLFHNTASLEVLDVSKWNTSSVTTMYGMFNKATSLKQLDVSKWDTSKVTTMFQLFNNTTMLEQLDVSKWDTSNVTNMYGMFNNTTSLKQLGVSKWDTSKVADMSYLFNNATSLQQLDVSKWNTAKVTKLYATFANTTSLQQLDVSNWDTSNVTTMYGMFNNATSLQQLDVSKWDTSKVTEMSSMFSATHALRQLDVSKWNTGNVTRMYAMFKQATSLQQLDVSKWDTSKVTTMSYLFNEATSLQQLDVSKWNLSQVTNLSFMFTKVAALQALDTSKWNTSNVTTMSFMFANATGLKQLDVSNWDTSKVTDMSYMFYNLKNLTTLTLGPKSIFKENAALTEIKTAPYSGAWTCKEKNKTYGSSARLFKEYNGSTPGLYTRELKK